MEEMSYKCPKALLFLVINKIIFKINAKPLTQLSNPLAEEFFFSNALGSPTCQGQKTLQNLLGFSTNSISTEEGLLGTVQDNETLPRVIYITNITDAQSDDGEKWKACLLSE